MIRILTLCDDLWHPADIIELGVEPLRSDELRFDVYKTAKDILTPERIAAYDLILNCKSNTINAENRDPWFEEGVTEVMPSHFRTYVENGGGFLAVHIGSCGNVKEGDIPGSYAAFVGCGLYGHPPRCGVDVEITAQHPVTEGVPNFHIRDEHYQVEVFAPDAKELFVTKSETGGTHVGGFVREMGKGRLCALTPGHTADVWWNEHFQRLVKNAIHWCTKT